MSDGPFFVGYGKVPTGLRGFLIAVVAALFVMVVAVSAAGAFWQGGTGAGRFRFDLGRQSITGVIELTPTPLLHVTQGTDDIPAGHALMLAGPGKNGVLERVAEFDGALVTVTGILLDRGDLDMLQVIGNANGLMPADAMVAAEGEVPDIPVPEPLGRWRLVGEICDGKCEAGAMNPGRGIAHRACASLCLIGGLPPVFVLQQPVEGASFLMIAGEAGNPMPEALYDWVAGYVSLEGEITRHGDLLIIDVDQDTLERTQ